MPTLTNEAKPVTKVEQEPFNKGGAFAIRRMADDVIELIVRIFLLGLVVYWTALLIKPFLSILVWSLILTVILHPAYEWLSRKLGGRRTVSAGLVTLASLAVFTGPVIWLGINALGGIETLYAKLGSGEITLPPPSQSVKSWPIVGESLYRYWDLATVDLKRALVEALPYLDPVKDMGRRMATSVATGIPAFIISIVVAGFFLRPARALVDALSKAFERILPAHGHEFVVLAGSTIRNVAQGVVGVSFLQGLLAGLGFVVAGIPAAGLLAIAVFIGGILQFQALVLLPIIVWAWTAMDWQSALLFTAYIVPVGLINNVLSPMVMAHGLKVPAAVMLLGLLGGALTHGVLGLFIGPIVLAVAWELLRAWLAKDGAEALANREAVETPTRNHFNKADHAGSEAKEGVSTGLIL